MNNAVIKSSIIVDTTIIVMTVTMIVVGIADKPRGHHAARRSPSVGPTFPSDARTEVLMDTHICFTRPETRNTIARVSVPDNINPMDQIRRLHALGYSIVNVNPPLPTDTNN